MSSLLEVTQELQTLNDTTFDNREILIESNDTLLNLDANLANLFDFLVEDASGTLEERREQQRYNERMLAALESGTPAANAPGAGDDEGGGLFGGLGLAGAGLGLGAAGLGALFAGGGYLIDQIVNMDAEGLKQNILTLLSIPDEVGGTGNFFVEGGTFFVAMTGLGAGLAAFALGSGVSAAVNFFTKDSDFAESVKSNVKTLLSIPDEVGGNLSMLAKGGTFIGAMTGLGIGLGVFGAGAGIAGLSDAITDFTNPDWAQSIKSNVLTLLSISDALGGVGDSLMKGGTFPLVMAGVASGLALFSAGSTVAGIADGVTNFTNPAWAQSIKDNVLTLFSIEDSLGGKLDALGESGTFVAVMSGIATGLTAFSVGKAANAVADFASSPNWAETIKQNVMTLTSITDALEDGDADGSKASRFAAGMSKIAGGLLAFTGSKAIGMLASVGEKILGFFGVDNPFDEIMKVADESERLTQGANAIERISEALTKFGSIDVATGDIDFEKLAKNLGRSIPLIQRLAEGGVYNPGWTPLGKIDFGGGLLDPSLRLDELAEQVVKVNYVLGRSTVPPSSVGIDQEQQTNTSNNAMAPSLDTRSFVDQSGFVPSPEIEYISTERRPSGQLGMVVEERRAMEDSTNNNTNNNGNVNVQNNSSTNVTNNNSTVFRPIPGPTLPPKNARDVQFNGVSP